MSSYIGCLALPSLDCLKIHASVRLMDLMAIFSDYYKAKFFPLTSSSVKMKSLKVMDHPPPSIVVVVSMEAAPLTPMYLVEVAPINSWEEALVGLGEKALASL